MSLNVGGVAPTDGVWSYSIGLGGEVAGRGEGMNQFDLGRVRAVVAEGSPMIRQGVRNALYGMGFREVVDTGLLTTAHQLCEETRADLLIINSDLEKSDSSFLIRELRGTRLGEDPFVVVVSLLPIADAEHVRRVVDSGADDLLLIPFAPEQLCSRLQSLITRRKPFVITHDYIGPDRRKTPRAGLGTGPSARQMRAPNPVAARAGGMPPERYRHQVETARAEIRTRRVGSLAFYVRREGRELLALGRDGHDLPEDLVQRMFRLEQVVEELVELSGTALDLGELVRLCTAIRTTGRKAPFADVEKLHGQTEAISARFGGI